MKRRLPLCVVAIVCATSGLAAAQGQHPAASTSPFAGLTQGQNKDQPIQIDAATLEVRDKSKIATFSGNVQVVQGDMTMKCRVLVVFYGPEAGASAAARTPAGGGSVTVVPQEAHDIRRIEARGDVSITTKDQHASGDLGVYDLKSKTVTLTGNVVVSRGNNVVRGDRVVVDTVTGYSRVESSTSASTSAPSRVRALILPNKSSNGNTTNVMSFGAARPN